ncbi:MAG TPA: DUF3857 domain-containing protein [Myxococcota bacterium]
MLSLLPLVSVLLVAAPSADRATALGSTSAVTGLAAAHRAMLAHDDDDDPAARTALLTALADTATSPIVRAWARRRRARSDADLDRAVVAFDALGMPRALRCIGPFSNTGGADFGRATTADDVAATIDAEVAGLDRAVRWTEVPRDQRGAFDIDDRFVARREVRARCVVVVDAPAATTAAVRVGASAPVIVRHGAHTVLSADDDHPAGFDQAAGLVALPRGMSLLVVELGMLARGGALELRVTAADGAPLRGLRFSSAVDDIKAAARTRPAAPPTTGLVSTRVDVAAATTWAAARDVVDVLLATSAWDHRAKPTLIERAYAALREHAPDDAARARALTGLAQLHLDSDPTRATALLAAASALAPGDVDVLVATARLREQQGDALGASQLWGTVAARAPHRTALVRERLQFERRRGVLGDVVDADILARAKTTKDPGLLLLAADVLEDSGDVAGALALAERVAGTDIGTVAARRAALASERLARDPGARDVVIAALRLRLRLAPTSHHLANQLAGHLLDLGDVGKKQVDDLVAQRLALFPERPEPRQLAARIALVRDDVESATAQLTAALALAPDDGELQRSLRALQRRAGGGDDLASRVLPAFDDDVVAAARQRVPADAAVPGAYIHHKVIGTRFFENGQLQHVEDIVVVVLDAKKAESLRAFGYGYSGGREQIDVLAAERIARDGRREGPQRVLDRGQDGKENGAYSDARSKTVVFAKIEDGDVLHVRIRKEATGLQNLFGDFFGDVEVLQTRLPVNRFRMTIEAPLSRPLYVGGRGAPQPVVREGSDRRTWDFVVDDIPGLVGEAGMPPWLEVASYISVSTYGAWGALGQWYEALVADQLRLDDDLRAVAARLKSEASDRSDLVRRIYEHVVLSTRYVGIELGIHGWKPYPVAEVYRRRFGDCKDKASLLVALLREVGVPAHLVMVRTIQLGHTAQEPASMWAFNHAIAYVPELDLFLDGTAERSGWRELPTMDQGAVALIVDGKDSRLVTIPVQAADANLNVSSYVLQIGSDGSLVTTGEERFRGANNARERLRFEDTANQRTTLERELAGAIPGVAVARVDVGDLSLGNPETRYTFAATLPRRAVVESDGSLVMPVSLYPHDVAGNYADQSARRFELFIDHPWRTRNVMRYVLPPGMQVVDLPRGGEVRGEHLQFTQTITKTDDGFIVDEDTAILSRRIPRDDYAAFRDQALAADRLMKRKLRIVPTTTTTTTKEKR